jgi:hypothetical protein
MVMETLRKGSPTLLLLGPRYLMGTIVVDEERQRDRLVYLLFSPPLEIKLFVVLNLKWR